MDQWLIRVENVWATYGNNEYIGWIVYKTYKKSLTHTAGYPHF